MNRFLAVSRWIAVAAILGILVSLAKKASWRGLRWVDLFWQGIVPIVPLILLLAPHFWRRICPVAVLNLCAARIRRGGREIGPPGLPGKINVWIKRYGVTLAAFLLWVLVPMRLLVFNPSPHATLALILALACAAIAGPWKAAWCSSICPIYPVEKFYGAAPVWRLADARCTPANSGLSCYRCALHCVDSPETETRYWKAMERAGSKRSAERMRRFFLGSFPGFVLAYWFLSVSDAPRPASAFAVYAIFFVFMIASYGCFLLAHIVFAGSASSGTSSAESRNVDLVVIALALNLYYTAASAGLSALLGQLGGWNGGKPVIRAGMLAGVLLVSLLWLRRAWSSRAPAWTNW